MSRYLAGIDLGQARDHSAIAILDRGARFTHLRERLALRVIERLPLGLAYEDQLVRLAAILARLDSVDDLAVVIDATGVGAVVVEMARRQLPRAPYALTITSGASATTTGIDWKVPKSDLIASLQVALQQRRLRIARNLPAASALVSELKAYRMELTPTGAASYSNDPRFAQHDDLVVAAALATYLAEKEDRGLAGVASMPFVWHCDNCGLPNHDRWTECSSCGQGRTEGDQPTGHARCANCKTVVDRTQWPSVTCPNCGEQLSFPERPPPPDALDVLLDAEQYVPGVRSFRQVPQQWRRPWNEG